MKQKASTIMFFHRFHICKFQAFCLFIVLLEIQCSSYRFQQGHLLMQNTERDLLPATSPSNEPHPFLPLQSPPPLIPFTNNSVPHLSGLCSLNFSTAESMMPVTAHDCFGYFAPYLANVMCCPQLEATVSILIGQSSKYTRNLALDKTQAKHCLSDLEQILASQGAASDLQKICTIHPSNLTEGSCPVADVMQLESTIDSPKLLAACQKIDPVNECCTQICQNAITEAAKSIAAKNIAGLVSTDGVLALPEHLSRVDDCRSIVLRWIASKLDPLPAKKVLRGLSNCKLNKACPLKLPDIKSVAKDCANGISNKTGCCSSMKTYVSHLQYQSFVTNLQALDCAAMFGMRLQKANITENVYDICHISLKDFSVQVGSQESGCLLPSLPTDAMLDVSTISFVCDLNDNIAAPWPSIAQVPPSSCKTIKFPALPAAASGLYQDNSMFLSLLVSLVSLTTLLQLFTSYS
ncbi:hypothetical protein AQUCO_04800004v1 [Aquilegia coerulea]|uniref:Uncharacterized protein n=1 Tax=Aquilegia coerulea TaxID=218851 RepID=A0A2G5CKK4_AQUCA|nr:hypothetical protein AQUCO_04800004v1 [Aquilegia coerulea]